LISALTPKILRGRDQPSVAGSPVTEPRRSPTSSPSAALAVGGLALAAAACSKGGDKEAAAAPPAAAKDKTRTLKYYPPPNDEELMTVDVIDHGSEVLIVRRDPSPLRGSPSTSVLLGSSSPSRLGGREVAGKVASSFVASAAASPGGGGGGGGPTLARASPLLQEPTLGRVALPSAPAPPQVQQVKPDSADSPATMKSSDASL